MTTADQLATEIEAYEAQRAELERTYLGKFVVFTGQDFIGAWDTLDAAATEAVARFGRGPYLIRQVGGAPPPTLPASVLTSPATWQKHAEHAQARYEAACATIATILQEKVCERGKLQAALDEAVQTIQALRTRLGELEAQLGTQHDHEACINTLAAQFDVSLEQALTRAEHAEQERDALLNR